MEKENTNNSLKNSSSNLHQEASFSFSTGGTRYKYVAMALNISRLKHTY